MAPSISLARRVRQTFVEAMAKLPLRLLLLSLSVLFIPAAGRAESEPAIRTLILIRHGIYAPQPGVEEKTGNGLTPLGREQAGLVAERLARLPLKIDSITSSELLRAKETGDIIAARLGLPCARDGLLNECMPVGAGLPSKPDSAAAETQLGLAWASYTSPAAGTSRHDVLVCHGNVIRWFVCRALGADTKQWTRMEIANCSITFIQVRPDGSTRVQVFNDVSHVPLDKQTWSGKGPGWPLPAQPQTKQRTMSLPHPIAEAQKG